MFKVTGFRVNEGIQVRGNGIYLDMIVRCITGPRRKREALIEVRGIPGLNQIRLKNHENPFILVNAIRVGISDDIKPSSNAVNIYYKILGNYYAKKREYE